MATVLTDARIRGAVPKAKPYKLAAGVGLCLVVMPDGAKYWRYRYRIAGREKMLSVGVYPNVALKAARQEADKARVLISQGVDPAEQRREQKRTLRNCMDRTFGAAANDWYEFNRPRWAVSTGEKARAYLDKDLLPGLGRRPIARLTPADLAEIVDAIERRGAFNVAKKTRQWLNQIFKYAIAKGLVRANPAEFLQSVAAAAPKPKQMAHLTTDDLPAFLKALDVYKGSMITKAAIRLALLTANRPGIVRSLRWKEVDLDSATWTIAKGREGMKQGYAHLTPLPHQAVQLLAELHRMTGTFEFVFPGRNDPRQPISDKALTAALDRMGYKNRQTMHGFRHLISTALNERGFNSDWIERQLAHGDPDRIRATYNNAHYLSPRREMMQAWADELDTLHSKASLDQPSRQAAASLGRMPPVSQDIIDCRDS